MIRDAAVLFFVFVALSVVHGAPRQVDLGKELEIEQWHGWVGAVSGARSKGLSPLAGRRVEITEWHRQYSSWGQQRAAWSTRDKYPSQTLTYDTVEREVRPRTMSGMNRRQTTMRNVDHLQRRSMVDRYRNAPVGRLEERQDMIHEMVEELSLQDINRYQFRSTRLDDGGLPVQQPADGIGSGRIRSKSTEGEGELYINRARTFFQSVNTEQTGRALPSVFSGSRADAARSDGGSVSNVTPSSSRTADSSPPPPASAPRVETGKMFIEVRAVD